MNILRMRGGFPLTCILLVLFFCASGVLSAPGQASGAGGDLLWQVATGGALAASNGRVVVAGSAGVQTFDGDIGTLLWQDSFFGATTVAMDAQQVIAVGANAIRAYDARNGALHWQGPLASGTVINAATMKGNQLLVAGSVMDATGAVQLLIRAYDARNGQIEWEDQSLPLNTRLLTSIPPTKAPLSIHGTRAYVVATVISQSNLFTPLCLVRAYDRNRGNLVWESVSQEPCEAHAVAAHNKQVVLAGVGTGFATFLDDYYVRSYNAQTGELLWQDKTHVLTGEANEAVAVDEEGKRAFVAGWVRSEISFGEAFLVRAYNMETGELYWEDQYLGSVARCFCHALDIAVDNGRVFAVGTIPFIVRAYDAKKGNLLWQNELPTGLAKSVAVDRGVVFAADTGVLRAYDGK